MTRVLNLPRRLRHAPTVGGFALWVLLVPLSVPALWPFYAYGLPRSFDGGLHLLRLALLDRHIQNGVFLPRWTPELLLGFGYPLYNFYAPGAYYIAEILYWLGAPFGVDHYAAFIGASGVAILGAGIGMFFLARDIFGPRHAPAALVAATAYLFTPYLLTNIYIRGALSEATAQALLPWIFWSTRRLFLAERPGRYYLPLTFSLGGLAITHNITLLFMPLLLLAYMALLWLPRRERHRAGWAALSLISAMGVSAFFWFPLIMERGYLADTAYEIARTVWLPGSMWTWRNFLDTGLAYEHTFARPIRVGIAQVSWAAAGFLAAGFAKRYRSAEWLFFLVVALAAGLFMGRWSLSIWQSVDALSVAQFAWRLLSILSLPLALGSGYLAALPTSTRLQLAWSALLIALVVTSCRPRLDWIEVFAREGVDLSTPTFAQIEIDKGVIEGGEGNSSIQEFRPRWVDRSLVLHGEATPPATDLSIAIKRADAFGFDATITAQADAPLRIANFYFPGWTAAVDGAPVLTYPTTNLGLLTFDVPPGEHAIRLRWAGTLAQRWAGFASLAALLLAAWAAWRVGTRALAMFPAILFVCGVTAVVWNEPPAPVLTPTQPIETPALRLLALRYAETDDGSLYLYPYWQTRRTPSADLRVCWTLLDSARQSIAHHCSYPYFNTQRADLWPASTLVDDAYRLSMSTTTQPGEYTLAVALEGDTDPIGPTDVAQVRITRPAPSGPQPQHSADAQFGDAIRLVGYNLSGASTRVTAAQQTLPVVHAGDALHYTLFWRATSPIDENYHAFIHLTDNLSRPIAQEDHLPGPLFQPPLLWDTVRLHPDGYRLTIPADAPSALYWPDVGLYEFSETDRLSVIADGQPTDEGRYRLPPVKVVNTNARKPTHDARFAFGDFAELLDYDLAPADWPIHPGDTVTLTLTYRARTQTSGDTVRFLQLLDADFSPAAQADSIPRAGGNPTWSWVPGEIIVDVVELQIAEQAAPGIYTLYTGFYPVEDPNARVPVTTTSGESIPERWAAIGQITIAAP